MSNYKVFFSIIVPVYNVEKYLKTCIESVLNQSFSLFELILVDDGATDSSSRICDEYAKLDERIIVLHKTNGGLVSARQAGCKIAKGEYCLCIDGDDWVENDYLETIHGIAQDYNPDIVSFNYFESTDENKKEILSLFPYGMYYRRDIEKKILPNLVYSFGKLKFNYSIWSKAFKRELYVKQQIRLDVRIKIGEDLACVIPCVYEANSIYFEKRCLYNYRYNNLSMTKTKKAFKWEGMALIYDHFNRRLPMEQFCFEEQVNQKVFHELVNIIKTQFYADKNYFLIKREIKEGLKNDSYKKVIKRSKFPLNSIFFYFKIFIKINFFLPFYILSKFK